jgi:DNA-binding winged helix-turn-helix (wHTH) protein
MSSAIRHLYKFECFLVDIDQRVLLREYRPVPLTPKVFETLLILLEQPGRIVEKNELMNRLWPDSFVEEANLTFNIQQVRKALGDNARHPVFIETVARRGYRFVADVEEVLTDSEQLQSQMRFDRKLAGASSPTSAAWPPKNRRRTRLKCRNSNHRRATRRQPSCTLRFLAQTIEDVPFQLRQQQAG